MIPDSLDPRALLADPKAFRWTLRATLQPIGARYFQPTNFPEVGNVIYGPPGDRRCIVDSPASMANHLEKVCLIQDELVPELTGMPYLRCVTDGPGGREVVATSLTEGHRIASTYFLEGYRAREDGRAEKCFSFELHDKMGLKVAGKASDKIPAGVAHPSDFWKVVRTVFAYDPNALVHGVLFPKWQLKLPRALTVHHEALGVEEVNSSGVKFDRLGKTNSGQPIFTVQRVTAERIELIAILDLAFIRSLGRGGEGLGDAQKEFIVALAIWKLGRLLQGPFRFRTNCDLDVDPQRPIEVGTGTLAPISREALGAIDIGAFIRAADFKEREPIDLYWAPEDLYRKKKQKAKDTPEEDDDADSDDAEEV